MTKPQETEYAAYYGKYVSLVPDGNIVDTLTTQLSETLAAWQAVPADKAEHRYAPGKWSTKEMMVHVIDTERVMAYRTLRIARGDKTPLPGFDQDVFMANTECSARSIADLADEFEAVRKSSLHLFRHLTDAAWQQVGTASDNPISARALAYIIAGHELYHQEILRDRYLA
ncbi:MAG: DinB family protein [Acidobacteria bacterium]|nr:DinB family protein [Acidobacteriota bacterium]